MRRSAVIAALALLLASPGPIRAQQTPQVLHNQMRPEITRGAAPMVGSLPAAQRMNLSIVLPLRNHADLKNLLARLYDPSSPDYRHFLSVEEFTQRYGPTAEDYRAVVNFAKSNDLTVTGTAANRLIVPVSGSVDQVQRAFNVRMNTYQHPTEDRAFFSPDREPTVNLNVPVAYIAGLDNYSLPHPMVIPPHQSAISSDQGFAAAGGSGPAGYFLASDMRAAYYGATTLDGTGQTVGLVEFDGYNASDVTQTFANAGQTYDVPINNVLLDGATGNPQLPDYGAEAEVVLDIVQAIGMAPGLNQIRVYIGTGGDDASVLNAIASENIARQISSSWSFNAHPDIDDPFFEEFAAQGQSFFQASGDSGAYGSTVGAFYPADDHYVTAVGGTVLTTSGAGGSWVSETAWNYSGGGNNADFLIPAWQSGVANSSNGGSTTLRNVPDVAMEAYFDNYVCRLGSCGGGWGGTSFAAARWAGFMALVNQQAVEAGTAVKGGIGFLNPSLYALAEGPSSDNDLHDITIGNNNCCNLSTWYPAVAGYDLVTGWGSPRGANLINDLAGSQVPGFWLRPSSLRVQVSPGFSGSTVLNVTDAGGFTGDVTLGVSSPLPPGIAASWGTNPASGSSVLTLTADPAAPASNTNLTITGTAGELSATTNLALIVNSPSFLLTANPNSLDIAPNGSAASTIVVTPQYSFSGSVSLSISGLPSGVSASLSPVSTRGTSVLILTAGNSIQSGISTLTVTGTSGNLTVTTSLTLNVHGASFQIYAGNITMNQGGSSLTNINLIGVNGFSGNVQLSLSGLPSGVTGSFSPNPAPVDGVNDLISIRAASNAAPGTSIVTITGTSGSQTVSALFSLTIQGVKPVPTVTVTPSLSQIPWNQALTVTVAVNGVGRRPVPTGSVSLSGPGFTQSSVSLVAGWATFSIPSNTLAIGADTLIATYAGDATYSPSAATGSVTVIRAIPVMSLSANPVSITQAQSTVVTVLVSGIPYPSGTVMLTSGGISVGSGTLTNGSINITVLGSALAVGADIVTASYPGDSVYNSVSGSMPVTVIASDSTSVYPAQSSVNLGTVDLGSSNPSPAAITFNFTAAKSIGSTAVVTQGAQGLDFANAGGGTCDTNGSSHVYNAGDSCTVNVSFTPLYAGARHGAVRLLDTSGNILATALLYGSGSGPQLVFPGNTSVTTLGGGLLSPASPAVDAKGNIYISDGGAVKEIPAGCTSANCVTTLGGGFTTPRGLAVDGSGNVYVGDTTNKTVTEIPPGCVHSGCMVTLGGGFNSPGYVAVDSSGNVYVSDYSESVSNGAVKEIPTGCTSGSCVSNLAHIDYPGGVAVDGDGNVYAYNGSVHLVQIVRCISNCKTGLLNTFSPVLSVDGSGNLYFGVAVDASGNTYTALNGAVHRQNLAIAPGLSFANTNVGSQSSDSPQTVPLSNIGNAPLNFPIPGSGQNPSVSANFVLDGSTTCPEVTPSSSAGTLAAGATCSLAVDFIPASGGSITGAVVLTDNNLNVANATQNLGLSGTGMDATPLTPWIQVNNGGWRQINSVTVSPGSTVNLGEQVLTGGSYSWTGPGGYTSTLRIASSVPLTSVSNVFTLTYINAAGATSTAIFTVNVGSTPLSPYIQVNNSAWQNLSTITVSPGSTVNLGEQVLTGGSYSWTGPGGYSSTSRIASGVPLSSASNVFILTYTNTAGATSTATFTVNVGSTPLTPYIQVNNGGWQQISTVTVSPGSTVNLGEQVLTGGSYNWTGPGGYSSTSRIASNIPLNWSSNVFTLTYTNTAGATSTATFTVNVGNTPLTPWVQVNNGGWQQMSTVTVSPGSIVNLGEQVLTGGSYNWTGPGGYTTSSRIASAVPLTSASNVFTLTYTNTAGAVSTAIFTVKVDSTPLTPWIQVNNGAWQQIATATVSPGSTVNLGEQVLTGGSYNWSGPGGYTSTSRIASNVPLPSASNVFTLTYTNSAGATSSATFTVTVGSTTLSPYIQVNNGAWQQLSSVTVNAGDTVNLGEQVLTGGSYSWTGPANYTSTSRIASNIPLSSGANVFALTYTNTYGATSTRTFTITVH